MNYHHFTIEERCSLREYYRINAKGKASRRRRLTGESTYIR